MNRVLFYIYRWTQTFSCFALTMEVAYHAFCSTDKRSCRSWSLKLRHRSKQRLLTPGGARSRVGASWSLLCRLWTMKWRKQNAPRTAWMTTSPGKWRKPHLRHGLHRVACQASNAFSCALFFSVVISKFSFVILTRKVLDCNSLNYSANQQFLAVSTDCFYIPGLVPCYYIPGLVPWYYIPGLVPCYYIPGLVPFISALSRRWTVLAKSKIGCCFFFRWDISVICLSCIKTRRRAKSVNKSQIPGDSTELDRNRPTWRTTR